MEFGPQTAQRHAPVQSDSSDRTESRALLRPNPRSFTWSQLLPPNNYRGYISNLLAVGCPESTVQDIVRGDAERAFAAKRRALGMDGTESGPWSKESEERLIASLLNQPAPAPDSERQLAVSDSAKVAGSSLERSAAETHTTVPGSEISSGITSARTAFIPSDTRTSATSPEPISPREIIARACASKPMEVSMPLAFQNVDPTAAGLNEKQQQGIADIQQNFVQQIGGTVQNANAPSYLTRWRRAQPEADQNLMALLGYQGYLRYEMAAYQDWLVQRELQRRNAAAQQ